SLINGKIKNIAESDLFKKVKHSGTDFEFFVNYEHFSKLTGRDNPLEKLGFPTDYAINIALNFENGKVVTESQTVFKNKEDKEKMMFYKSEGGVNYLSLVTE